MELEDVFDLYIMPPGRGLYSAQGTQPLAQALSHEEIVRRAKEWLTAAEFAHSVELRFRVAQARPQYGPRAGQLDTEIDRTLGQCEQFVHSFDEVAQDPDTDPVLAQAVQLLSREIFPRGAQHIMLKSFVEALVDVRAIVARLSDGGDLAAAGRVLNLQPFVARLDRLATEFAAEIAKTPKAEGPGWDAVRAARTQHHGAFLRWVAVVLGQFPDNDDASRAVRARLLEPAMVQQRALKALYRARRPVTDVDPATGGLDPQSPADPTPLPA